MALPWRGFSSLKINKLIKKKKKKKKKKRKEKRKKTHA
jgi:hypothetical protein